jgi:hypothetical protein
MLVGQATMNSESQFLDSPDLRNEVIARLQVELGLAELFYQHTHEATQESARSPQ